MWPVVSLGQMTPAVTTIESKPPYASATWSNIARTLARSVMLQASPMAGPQPEIPDPATPIPCPSLAVISCAVASADSNFMSTHTTCAPSFARRRAASVK